MASILSEHFEGGKLRGIERRQSIYASGDLEFSGLAPGQKISNGDGSIAFETWVAFFHESQCEIWLCGISYARGKSFTAKKR
jgi:hypothetical protein